MEYDSSVEELLRGVRNHCARVARYSLVDRVVRSRTIAWRDAPVQEFYPHHISNLGGADDIFHYLDTPECHPLPD